MKREHYEEHLKHEELQQRCDDIHFSAYVLLKGITFT